jgi:hypothetical protein
MSTHPAPFFPILQVEEIAFAMSLFVAAASLKIPLSTGPSRLPTCECGTVFHVLSQRIQNTANLPLKTTGESSLKTAFMTMWTHYDGDQRRQSICARVLGFHSLMVITEGALVEPWLFSDEETPEVVTLHPAVVEAVAMTPLGYNGVMAAPGFLRTLTLIANTDTRQAA